MKRTLWAIALFVVATFGATSSRARADIDWQDGTQTVNEFLEAPTGTLINPPQPGPAVHPPGAALSVFTNSGDVPTPNWEGVEVEADFTHSGTLLGDAVGNLNRITIARQREFTVSNKPVQFMAILSGRLTYSTGPPPAQAILRRKARSRVIGAGVPAFAFDLDLPLAALVNVGSNQAETTKYDFKALSQTRKLPAGMYTVASNLELQFSHQNATVDWHYLDTRIGVEGITTHDAAGNWDEFGLDGVLRNAPARNTQVNGRTGPTAGATDNPSVSFDAGTGTLSFAPGTVNVGDDVGGLSDGVDPAYAADPMIGATMSISDLTLLGFEGDGAALFSGGTVTVSSGADVFFEGSFSEFRVRDTTTSPWVTSFGIFEDLDFDSNGLEAPFLEALFAGGISDPLISTDFYFLTQIDLATATNGFTQSVPSLGASYYVGGSIPEPATLALLVLGGAVLLRRRRR